MIDREDLIWLAGICEGEAAFDMHSGRYPRVRVGMTDRDVVGRVATLLGVRVRCSYRAAPRSAMWHAELSGARAAEVLRQLLPLMGARRSAKIATLLGHYELARSQRENSPGPRIERPPALPHAV